MKNEHLFMQFQSFPFKGNASVTNEVTSETVSGY